jgi:ketosteroid isomerase-like protein
MPDPDRASRWIERYERAWRTAGTETLADLFTPDATYLPAPFDEPVRGLSAIAAFWDDERNGPDEVFTLRSEVFLDAGARAVGRVEVDYGDPVTTRYRDLWLMEFDADDRVRHFEEWPFSPEQPRVAPPAEPAS